MIEEIDLVEGLKIWMYGTGTDTIDDILEFLEDENCLNEKGKDLRHNFWEKYIKENHENNGILH